MTTIGSCNGTGLIALDAILNGKPTTPAKLSAGGSCGNVLTILSFLGWVSNPIARLAQDKAAELLINDLRYWGVNAQLITKEEKGSTPIIIHRIFTDKFGLPKHRFEFRDPETKRYLPSYRPLISRKIQEKFESLPSSDVFYFDRVNRASIELAKYHKENGSTVVFEPSSFKDDKAFRECIETSDIIKFSNDRINNYRDVFPDSQSTLEIETCGKDGLLYRFKSNGWKKVEGYHLEKVVDSAGAGDWCTSGIISQLGIGGISGLNSKHEDQIVDALRFGQLLGAINCCYDGARGIMYNLSKSSLDIVIQRNLKTPSVEINDQEIDSTLNKFIEVSSVSEIF